MFALLLLLLQSHGRRQGSLRRCSSCRCRFGDGRGGQSPRVLRPQQTAHAPAKPRHGLYDGLHRLRR